MSKLANATMKKHPPKSKPPVFKAEDFIRSNLPVSQIQQLKQAFDLFDIHQSGRIDPKDLKNSLTLLKMQQKNGTFYNAVVAVEKEGPIDFNKFIEIISARTGLPKTRDNIKKVFSTFDEDKSGFISQKNLKKVLKDVGMTDITNEEINQMIEKADLDNDGLVSEQQFYLIMTKKSKK